MIDNFYNVIYKKSLGRNEMIIELNPSFNDSNTNQFSINETFRWHMIRENSIDGFLDTSIQYIDGTPTFNYNISGLQSLRVILDSTPLDYSLLCKIFLGIYRALLALEKYMLLPEHILFDAEYIFLSADYSQVFLCYYPLNQHSFQDSIRMFFDYLLKKVNHSDEKCVYLAYTMHTECHSPDFNMNKLYTCLSNIPCEPTEPNIDITSKTEKPFIHKSSDFNTVAVADIPAANNYTPNSTVDLYSQSYILKCILLVALPLLSFGILTALYIYDFYNLSFYLTLLAAVLLVTAYNGYHLYISAAPSRLSTLAASNVSNISNGFNASRVSKDDISTVLLSEPISRETFSLVYAGEDNHRDIELTAFPFVIGKNETCNGCISHPTVSRIHAKITRLNSDNQFYIEDLNSTNGTFLNHKPLAPYEKTLLNTDDYVSFGHLTYMFH